MTGDHKISVDSSKVICYNAAGLNESVILFSYNSKGGCGWYV